jgi:hypothetical protein
VVVETSERTGRPRSWQVTTARAYVSHIHIADSPAAETAALRHFVYEKTPRKRRRLLSAESAKREARTSERFGEAFARMK